MSAIANSIDTVVKLGLVDLLKDRDFKRTGRTFHRRAGDVWQILNVQASQQNMGAAGSFTLNIGIYHPRIAELAGSLPLNGKPKEYESTIRERIGYLMPERRDHWWEIGPSTDVLALAREVGECVERYAVPWLERHTDIAQISSALQEQPTLVSAAAALASGDLLEAQKRANRMLVERPRASAAVRSWARASGIEIAT